MPKTKKTESKKKDTDSKIKPKKNTSTKVSPKKTKTGASTKAKTTSKSSAKTKAKAKTSTKANVKKTSTKASSAKTKKTTKKASKAKPIIVDIIKDEDLESETFFSDESLEVGEIDLQSAQEFFLDLEEGEVPRESSEEGLVGDEIEEKAQKAWLSNEENDKQKQFYKELASEIDENKPRRSSKALSDSPVYKNKKSIRLYRSLAWKFLILVSFLAAIVFYFSFTKLTILITPEIETTSDTLFLKVANQSEAEVRPGDARTQVSGSVNEVELDLEKTYLASGEEYLGEEVSGKVKIVNNYNRSQSLVATTRLLSPDNKQYRIKSAVTIPAGASAEVEIYSDKIDREMAIGPTRFTIPGLWVGLQDKIYAESSEAFVYEQKMQKYVKASDIQLAKSEIHDLILEKAKNLKTLRSQDKTIYKILEPYELDLDVDAGDKVDSFDMKVKADVVIISLSEEEVKNLASTKLKVLVPDDKELTEFNPDSLSYVLENYDDDTDVATIKVTFSGQMILKKDAKIINKENLVSLKAPQIRTYLKDYPEIGQYDLKFYPSFVDRAPRLVDRIEIKIKK